MVVALLASCGSAQPAVSGTEDYYSPQDLKYEDHIYDPDVHTVQLFKKGFELSPAVLELGSTDPLSLIHI